MSKNYRIEYLADGVMQFDYEDSILEAQSRCVALIAEGYEPVLFNANDDNAS